MKKVVHTLITGRVIGRDYCLAEALVENNNIVGLTRNPVAPDVIVNEGPDTPPRGLGNCAVAMLKADRIKGPLIRSGPRGKGSWKAVSWDEALDYTAQKCRDVMAEHGAKALSFCSGPGLCIDLYKTFLHALGSPDFFTQDDILHSSANLAMRSVLGCQSDEIIADWGSAKHIVLYGANLLEAPEINIINAVLKAREQGCKIICIDPKVTVTATKADNYMMIRPGSDLALNYALIHVIIKHQLYNGAFVDQWVHGFDKLADFVETCTPAWAAEHTGIAASEIITWAETISQSAPAVIFHSGHAHHPDELHLKRSLLILNALLGGIEAPGSLFFRRAGQAGLRSFLSKALEEGLPLLETTRFDHDYPLTGPADTCGGAFIRAALEDKLKALFVFDSDLLRLLPDHNQTIKVLQKLDLIVSNAAVMRRGALWADVILPESHFLEKSDPLHLEKGLSPFIAQRQACVAPQFDTKPGWWIIKELAQRLDQGKYFPYTKIDEIHAFQLKDSGLELKDFKSGFIPLDAKTDQNLNFKTPSGKIEFFSDLLAQYGLKNFPLQEKSKNDVDTFWLIVQRRPRGEQILAPPKQPVLWINPEPARRLKIKASDQVEVCSSVGKARLKVLITDKIHPEAVFMVVDFEHRELMTLPEYILDEVGGLAWDHTLVKIKNLTTESVDE